MAKPLSTGKPSVDLASAGPRVSKIRRDPPPAARKTVVPDREEVDRRAVAVGVVAVALALAIIIVGLASYNGWSPSEHVVRVKMY